MPSRRTSTLRRLPPKHLSLIDDAPSPPFRWRRGVLFLPGPSWCRCKPLGTDSLRANIRSRGYSADSHPRVRVLWRERAYAPSPVPVHGAFSFDSFVRYKLWLINDQIIG